MMMLREAEQEPDANQIIQCHAPQTSYEAEVDHLRKLGSPPGIAGIGHDPLSTDR